MQIPDEANFCWKCRKPQKSGVKHEESQREKWAICEIVWKFSHSESVLFGLLGDNNYGRFNAIAIGRTGKYLEDCSKPFALDGDCCIKSDDPQTIAAHDDWVKRLVQDGWEPIESSTVIGFNNKFRRRLM